MGVGGNSSGGRSLNDRKERGAGRQNQQSAEVEAIREFEGDPPDVPIGGAHGKDGVANRAANPLGEGGGGGGGSPDSDLQDVNPSTRPARKQGP